MTRYARKQMYALSLLLLAAALAACGSKANPVTNTDAGSSVNETMANESSANVDAADNSGTETGSSDNAAGTAAVSEPAAEPAANNGSASEHKEDHGSSGKGKDDAHSDVKPKASASGDKAVKPAPAEKAPAPKKPVSKPALVKKAEVHVVEIKDYAFSPASLEIRKGDTVRFVNRDDVGHTATAEDGSFDTGILDQDTGGEVVFDETGTFGYYCKPHPGMKGSIVVK